MAYSPPSHLPRRRVTFMDCPIDLLSLQEMLEYSAYVMRARVPLQHGVVNVAKLVTMRRNAALRQDVAESDIITIDGMGVVWGARLCGHRVPERVAGIHLMESLLALCETQGFRPYLLGATPEVLEAAVGQLRIRHPRLTLAGWHHGYFSEEEEPQVMEAIRASKADCLFIAITSPMKERLMRQYRQFLDVPFVMGVGGSLDVLAGRVKRAPVWMQYAGMEWAWRLMQEPRRLWKRYLVTNLLFAFLLTGEWWRSRYASMAHAV